MQADSQAKEYVKHILGICFQTTDMVYTIHMPGIYSYRDNIYLLYTRYTTVTTRLELTRVTVSDISRYNW